MITVGTPVEDGGINLRFVAEAAVSIGHALALKSDYHVVVVKSTVVPGTTDDLVRRILEDTSELQCGPDFGLGMNPEFLREGEAVNDFMHPDRIVIGANDSRARGVIAQIYAGFPQAEIVHTNARTAEMIGTPRTRCSPRSFPFPTSWGTSARQQTASTRSTSSTRFISTAASA